MSQVKNKNFILVALEDKDDGADDKVEENEVSNKVKTEQNNNNNNMIQQCGLNFVLVQSLKEHHF